MNKPQEAEKRKPTTEPRKKKEQQGPARSNWRTTVEEIEDEPQPRKNQELPFRNVPAVEFASGPPQPKTFNPTRAVPTAPGPKEKSYELKAPIETTRPEALREIMKEVLDSYVRLPFKLLLDSNPELQKETKRMVTKVRVPVGDLVVEQALASEVEGPADELPFIETELSAGSYVQSDAICTRELPFASQLTITTQPDGLVPAGGIIVNDPVVQYLNSLPSGEAPKQVFVSYEDTMLVGRDSAALRVLYPLINGVAEEEAICDGGSQIVSMSLETAKHLGLSWNPDICIFMQSANGQVEKSVGLCKNAAFRFGDITLYLQVHVIKNPAYKVLLGRPFEVLAASTIENGSDGSQTITLTDPNSKLRCVIPTFERGTVRTLKKVRDASTEIVEEPARVNFQSSMS